MQQRYWFRAKMFGWGWYPTSWQGWLVTAIYTIAIVRLFLNADSTSHSSSDTLINFALPFIILTTLLLVVCYKTGEKPRWRWGK